MITKSCGNVGRYRTLNLSSNLVSTIVPSVVLIWTLGLEFCRSSPVGKGAASRVAALLARRLAHAAAGPARTRRFVGRLARARQQEFFWCRVRDFLVLLFRTVRRAGAPQHKLASAGSLPQYGHSRLRRHILWLRALHSIA